MSAPPPKPDAAKQILAKGKLMLHFDPRKPGVDVPERFRAQPTLVLAVGHAMHVPIPDLRLDETALYGTLSFSQTPYACTVPWSAVYALVGPDQKGFVWQSEVPPDAPSADANKKKETESPEVSCSFCGCSQRNAHALVAAERAFICDVCVVRFRPPRGFTRVLAYVRERFVSTSTATPRGSTAYRDLPHSTTTCSFCQLEVSPLHEGVSARICVPCAALADEVVLERNRVRAGAKR
jgi:hypothetical protein